MQYEDARSDIRRSAAIIILEQQALLDRTLKEAGLSKDVLLLQKNGWRRSMSL
jgi:hypothetical protein